MTDTTTDLPAAFRQALNSYRDELRGDDVALAGFVDEHGDRLLTILSMAAEAMHQPHGSPELERALDAISSAVRQPLDVTAKAHVALGLDGDYEQPWITDCSPGDYDDDPRLFEADVPKVLWDDLERTWRTASGIQARIFHAADIDITTGQPVTACAEWRGDPGSPAQERWYVSLPPSGDENVWPAGGRPVNISYGFDTEAEAVEALAGLPDEIYLVPGHLGPPLTPIARSQLFVREDGWGGIGPSECHRCGRTQNEHEQEG